MKQRKVVLLAIAILIGIITGCSGRGGSPDTVTAAKVGERIRQAASLSELQQGDAEKLRKTYQIEVSDVADFVLYTALSNVKADELAIIKVKDASKTESVMEHMRQRIKIQAVKFKDYRPEEYYLIEKHVLEAKGLFVLFAVSKDANRIKREFDDAVMAEHR
jgi:hypothetical protein